jgi:translocation and assembly module TamB
MRRVLRAALWVLGLLLLLPVVAVAAVVLALNIGPGRIAAEQLIGRVTGGTVVLEGLSGRFPDALRLHHLEVRDSAGAWLLADDVVLDWSPTRLLRRTASIDRLEAARVQMPRMPAASTAAPAPTTESQPFTLPVRVTAQHIHVGRIELGAGVLGSAAVLSVDASADGASLQAASADLALHRLDAPGDYKATVRIDPARVAAMLDAAEPDGGLIATVATLPGLGPLSIKASLDGPQNAAATNLSLTAGPLQAQAGGTLDLEGSAADLDLSASAPAMTPRPDVAWQSVELQARVHGPFTAPDASGQLRIEGLAAVGAAVQRLVVDIQGNAGRVGLHATAEGVRLPGPEPALLAAAPVVLEADARLDDPTRPVTFALNHPLLTVKGEARTGGDLSANADVAASDFAPLAAIGGIDLHGSAALRLRAAVAGGVTRADLDGKVSITGGLAPVPALLGDATLGASAQLAGSDITLSRLEIDGKTLRLSAQGSSKAGALDATYHLGLADLVALAPTLTGALEADGRVQGPTNALSLDTTVKGEVGAPNVPRGPVTLTAALTGLPGAPAGQVTAEGTLEGAPLALGVTARRESDGALHATIERADWRSLHAAGTLSLPAGAKLPLGHVDLRMDKLDDLRPFIGQPLSGSVAAQASLDAQEARLDAELHNAGLPGNRVGHAVLTARVADPTTEPVVNAQLTAEGIDAAGVKGSAKVDVSGPQAALAVRTTTALQVSGTDAQISGAAVVNAPAKTVQLGTLQVAAKGETLRLLAPAQIRLADGVAVDRLRLGVREAVLDVAGRLSPTLDATATLRAPADLARLASPELASDGTIAMDARLTGTPALPTGTVKLTADEVRLRSGPGRAIPAANLTATAQLAGGAARIDSRLSAGPSLQLTVAGQAPLGAGALDLRATGALDLVLLDPVLTAAGRRARGRVTLDATVAGTVAAPRIGGTAQLSKGELQDFAQGVRITGIAASLRADGDTVRIASFTGRAGPGTVAASGSVGVLAPGLPVDLTVTLRNARPLASDQLSADLDADLTVQGQAAGTLQAAGRIGIKRAEIRIPERLPTSIAVLDVRRPGQKPPAPPAASSAIGLDLTVNAPRAIFVRGRGLDAELAGELRVKGSSTAPQVSGGFDLRRGTISVAGTTLTFTRGRVGFDGTGVTGKIDPTLDFAADSTTGSVTATLGVGGYASAPKIKLSSVPELPQDEVLAYLLFKRSAKDLGPFQLAEIAGAVASLTGIGGSAANPLESVRKGLGLDRLSVGGGASGSAPSVEAGRYVRNGVYVGAKQGTTGGQTQATVQIDITKGLKVQTDVGTGQGGNSVGLTYQFEY